MPTFGVEPLRKFDNSLPYSLTSLVTVVYLNQVELAFS
jgi:hypothetical protein